MSKNKSTIYPYKPCPKCGSSNLGFGSGRDMFAFFALNEKAKLYTYTICHDCNYEYLIWQKYKEKSDDLYNRHIKEWNNMGKNMEKHKCLIFLKNHLKQFMKKIISTKWVNALFVKN